MSHTTPSRNLWPAGIITAFVVFISGMTTIVVVACRDRSDLVTPDYYEQELRYQSRIDSLNRTAPFASEITAAYDAENARILISLPPKHVLAGAKGTIALYRPNHAGSDRSVDMAANPEGRQFVPTSDLDRGFWKVHLRWKLGSAEYFAERYVVVGSVAPPDSGRPSTRL